MDCKDIGELLISYLDGELSEEQRKIVELHLSACHSCRKELEDLSLCQNQLRQSFAAVASKAPSPQVWARLQQRLVAEGQPSVAVFNRAKSKLGRKVSAARGGLSSRPPAWKPALVGALVVALIAGLALTIPSHFGQSQEVLAAEIAQNDPQVRE